MEPRPSDKEQLNYYVECTSFHPVRSDGMERDHEQIVIEEVKNGNVKIQRIARTNDVKKLPESRRLTISFFIIWIANADAVQYPV
jgi:hypothetical protein